MRTATSWEWVICPQGITWGVASKKEGELDSSKHSYQGT